MGEAKTAVQQDNLDAYCGPTTRPTATYTPSPLPSPTPDLSFLWDINMDGVLNEGDLMLIIKRMRKDDPTTRLWPQDWMSLSRAWQRRLPQP